MNHEGEEFAARGVGGETVRAEKVEDCRKRDRLPVRLPVKLSQVFEG